MSGSRIVPTPAAHAAKRRLPNTSYAARAFFFVIFVNFVIFVAQQTPL